MDTEIPPPLIDESSDEECDKYVHLHERALTAGKRPIMSEEERQQRERDNAIKEYITHKVKTRGW